jgi:hypothetical protein
LLEKLNDLHDFGKDLEKHPDRTLYPLLFNPWARRILKKKASTDAISRSQARRLFRILRTGSQNPPYRMEAFKACFVSEFMEITKPSDSEAKSLMKDALIEIWREFSEEYAWIDLDDLDGKYSRFISISTTEPRDHRKKKGPHRGVPLH